MLFYFIPPFLALLGAHYYKRLTPRSRGWAYIMTTITAVFIYCCVYINGSDWPIYERYYNNVTSRNIFETPWEWGFCIIVFLCKEAGIGFFVFLIIAKSFSLITISNVVRNYSLKTFENGNLFWMLFVFYSGFCMYLYVETIIRFAIALAIVSMGYKYLINRRFIRYFFMISIAILFHKSAIIMLPLYFCKSINISSKKILLLFVLILLFCSPILLLNIFGLLADYVSPLFLFPLMGYTDRVANADFTIFSLGNVVYMFFLLFCLLNRRNIENRKNGHKLFAFCVIYFLISFISFSAGSVGRISLYLMPFFILGFIASFSGLSRLKSVFVKLFIFIYFISSMGSNILSKKSFLPYSNYLFSVLTGDTPSFAEREGLVVEDD